MDLSETECEITAKIKENYVENGYKIIKLNLLLGFNGESLLQNNIIAF